MIRETVSMVKRQVKPALIIFLLLTLLTGILYPLAITGIAHADLPVPGEREFY